MLGSFLLANGAFNFGQPLRESIQQIDARFDALGAQTEFFHEPDGTSATAAQLTPGFGASSLRCTFAERNLPVMAISLQQRLQRAQVVWQAANDLFFFQAVGYRNLDGAIERQLATVDLLQRLVGFHQHEVVFEQLGAETTTGFFDAFGELDFFSAGQKGDFSHLSQIHANRVIRPGFTFVDGKQLIGAIQLDLSFGELPGGCCHGNLVIAIVGRQFAKTAGHDVRALGTDVFEFVHHRIEQGCHSLGSLIGFVFS